jgi:ABC-2 type transport system permease protein
MTFAEGTFAPAPGRGRIGKMLFTHARTELMLTLRNGEQLLLTLLIPLALLIGLTLVDVISLPEPRIDAVTPRVFALAVMSSAFTGQAIALGFDRRYGVIKRLAATALPRWLLVGGRLLACLAVVLGQLIVLGVVAAFLGWSPSVGGVLVALPVILLGTLAFGALGVLLGGALKAEVVLALANIVWLVLLLAGGVVVATTSLPAGVADVVRLLPSGALADALRQVLAEHTAPSALSLVVLVAWAAAGTALAARTTKLS